VIFNDINVRNFFMSFFMVKSDNFGDVVFVERFFHVWWYREIRTYVLVFPAFLNYVFDGEFSLTFFVYGWKYTCTQYSS